MQTDYFGNGPRKLQIMGKKTKKIVNKVGAVEPVCTVGGEGLISLRNSGNLCGKKKKA